MSRKLSSRPSAAVYYDSDSLSEEETKKPPKKYKEDVPMESDSDYDDSHSPNKS